MNTESFVGMRCVVRDCQGRATGPPIVFLRVHVLLCALHRADFCADPMSWNGEVDPTGQRVLRMWRRQGIGSAS